MQNKGWLKELAVRNSTPFWLAFQGPKDGICHRFGTASVCGFLGRWNHRSPLLYREEEAGFLSSALWTFRFWVSLFIPTTRNKDTVIIKGLLGNLGSVRCVRCRLCVYWLSSREKAIDTLAIA